MEFEVRRENGRGSDKSSTMLVASLEEQVKIATEKLLLTNFPACLEICRNVVTAAKSCEEQDPVIVQRLGNVCEMATVIAIQALAEQGEWRDVIPFVEQVYTPVASCPATIMQMCLLLHAQVREYMVCHSLVNSWLDWDDHSHHPDSGVIVGIYVTNVLTPLGAFNLIPQVVERCSVLSTEERQNLLSPKLKPRPYSGHGQVHQIQSKLMPDAGHETEVITRSDSLTTSEAHSIKKDRPPSGYRIISLYLQLARRLWRNLAKKGWCQYMRKASKLFFLVSFVLLAILHAQTDVTTNFVRALEVCKPVFQALSSMWNRQPAKSL